MHDVRLKVAVMLVSTSLEQAILHSVILDLPPMLLGVSEVFAVVSVVQHTLYIT